MSITKLKDSKPMKPFWNQRMANIKPLNIEPIRFHMFCVTVEANGRKKVPATHLPADFRNVLLETLSFNGGAIFRPYLYTIKK